MSFQPSAVSYQLSAISGQESAVSGQLSAYSYQPEEQSLCLMAEGSLLLQADG